MRAGASPVIRTITPLSSKVGYTPLKRCDVGASPAEGAILYNILMQEKLCVRCNASKPITEFAKKSATRLQPFCKKCNNAYCREHYINNKSRYLQRNLDYRKKILTFIHSVKSTAICSKCGEGHISCLDFHHLEDDKKDFNISLAHNHGHSIERVKSEISKCIILCSNCHRKEHYRLRKGGPMT